jgi:hypothetical protein
MELTSPMIHLSSASQHAPSADDSQPWRFRCTSNTISVEYAADRIGALVHK